MSLTHNIADYVDLARYRWVCFADWTIPSVLGDVRVPRGRMSDGSSGVPDWCMEAFFLHDELYKAPWAWVDGEVRRVTRLQADRAYAAKLVRRGYWWCAPHRWLGVMALGGRPWRTYRRSRTDRDNLGTKGHFV